VKATPAAYHDYIAAMLEVACYTPEEAALIAGTSLEIEIALNKGILTPEEGNDPRNRYGSLSCDEVQALIPELDLDLYVETMGFKKPERTYMFEPRAPACGRRGLAVASTRRSQ
jgi:putative endopeptidase